MKKRSLASLPGLALLAAALVTLGAAEAHAQESCDSFPGPEPPPDSIRMYSGQNFGGDCIQLRAYAYPHAGYWNFSTFGWNDRVQSLKVGSAVRVKMFLDAAFTGYRFTVYSNSPLLPTTLSSSARLEDAITSEACDDLQEGEVAVYEHANFSGDCFIFQTQPNFGFVFHLLGFANDAISSFRSRSSLQVTLGFNDPPDGSGIDFTIAFPGQDQSYVGDWANDQITTAGM
jgi:hypothetical protein